MRCGFSTPLFLLIQLTSFMSLDMGGRNLQNSKLLNNVINQLLVLIRIL